MKPEDKYAVFSGMSIAGFVVVLLTLLTIIGEKCLLPGFGFMIYGVLSQIKLQIAAKK